MCAYYVMLYRSLVIFVKLLKFVRKTGEGFITTTVYVTSCILCVTIYCLCVTVYVSQYTMCHNILSMCHSICVTVY